MTEYRHFLAADFINDPFFKSWILDKNSDAIHYWEKWMHNNGDRKEFVNQAKLILLTLQKEKSGEHIQVNEEENNLHTASYYRKKMVKIRQQYLHKILLTSAVCFVIFSGLTLYFTDKLTQNSWLTMSMYFLKIPPKIVSTINYENIPKNYDLPDGSSVLLHPGCELNYPTPFPIDKREVFLVGNAYFQVVMDENRPFIVKTAELNTKTMNAHFKVNATQKAKTATVVVDSGAVLVSLRDNLFMKSIFSRFHNSSPNQVELTTGQEAVFNRIGEIFTTVE